MSDRVKEAQDARAAAWAAYQSLFAAEGARRRSDDEQMRLMTALHVYITARNNSDATLTEAAHLLAFVRDAALAETLDVDALMAAVRALRAYRGLR